MNSLSAEVTWLRQIIGKPYEQKVIPEWFLSVTQIASERLLSF